MGAERDTRHAASPSSPAVRSAQTAAAAVPCSEVVLAALVETAWAFPGGRISCARLLPGAQLEVLASTGGSGPDVLTGQRIDFGPAPRIFRLLGQGEPVCIEDVHCDSRLRLPPARLEQLDLASAMLLPVLGERGGLLGVVMFDAPRPRTWSHKDELALEQVLPVVSLMLENLSLREALSEANQRIDGLERRLGAARGVVDAAVHDGRVLIEALLEGAGSADSPQNEETVAQLQHRLFELLGDLAAVPDRMSSRRERETIDLNELLASAAPVLRAVLGPEFRLLVRTDPLPVWVHANRTGLDRLLRTVVSHATGPGLGKDVVLRAYTTPTGSRIEIGGDAIGTDDRFLQVVSGRPEISMLDVGIDLWQARCELLLGGGEIGFQAGPDGTKVFIDLRPPASAPAAS